MELNKGSSLILIIFMLSTYSLRAQLVIYTEKKNSSPLKLGAKYDKIVEQLGPGKMTTYALEKEQYTQDSIDPNMYMPFIIGFDYVVDYSEMPTNSEVPVYKLYFKHQKLVYVVFAEPDNTAALNEKDSNRVENRKALYFGLDDSTAQSYGEYLCIEKPLTGIISLHAGWAVFFLGGRVSAIHIFHPYHHQHLMQRKIFPKCY